MPPKCVASTLSTAGRESVRSLRFGVTVEQFSQSGTTVWAECSEGVNPQRYEGEVGGGKNETKDLFGRKQSQQSKQSQSKYIFRTVYFYMTGGLHFFGQR